MSGTGPRENVFATRMALTNMKLRLKGAQTGHSLLAKKRDALMTRFRTILKKVDEVWIRVLQVIRVLKIPMRTGETKDGKSYAASVILDGGSDICYRGYFVSGAGASQDGVVQSDGQTGERFGCCSSWVRSEPCSWIWYAESQRCHRPI